MTRNEADFMHLALRKFRSTRKLINPYDSESVILINHDPTTAQSTPSYDFLSNSGIPKTDLDLVLDQTSRLKSTENGEHIDPYSLNQSELENWVQRRVMDIYPLVDSSLNASSKYGFNEHGLPHAEEILRSSQNLLSALGIQDERIKQRLIIAALTHDLGNFISRENHEVASVFLLEQAMPELKTRLKQWRLIRKAILFHNIPFLRTLYCEESGAEDKINILRNNLNTDALLLTLSDKTSIGRGRLTRKTIDRQSVNEDPHIPLNLLVSGSHTGFSEDRHIFQWSIDFSPEPNDIDSSNINGLFLHHDGHPDTKVLAFVPDVWHNNHRLYGVPHMSSWYSSFIQTYFNRVKISILTSFALNPDQEMFELSVREKTGERSGYTITEQIYREDIDKYLATLKRMFLPKIARKKMQEE